MFTLNQNNANRMLARLLEEGGEIAGAVKSFFGRPLRPEVETGNISKVWMEIGDTAVILHRLCQVFGVTLEEAIDMALAKYETRLKELEA